MYVHTHTTSPPHTHTHIHTVEDLIDVALADVDEEVGITNPRNPSVVTVVGFRCILARARRDRLV